MEKGRLLQAPPRQTCHAPLMTSVHMEGRFLLAGRISVYCGSRGAAEAEGGSMGSGQRAAAGGGTRYIWLSVFGFELCEHAVVGPFRVM